MINFSNVINLVDTPVYDIFYMKATLNLSDPPESHDKLDECIEKTIDDIPIVDDKFLKIIELCISPYCRYINIPYTKNVYDTPAFWEQIPFDIQGVLNVKYEKNQDNCEWGSVNNIGRSKKNFINIHQFNNRFTIILTDRGVETDFEIIIPVKRYNSSELLIFEINRLLTELNIENEITLNVAYNSNDSFKIQMSVPDDHQGILPQILIPGGFKTLNLNPGLYPFETKIVFTPYIYYIAVTNMYIFIFSVDTIIHEFMHFLGMVHTTQINANNPIEEWNYEPIEKYFIENNMDPADINEQITDKIFEDDEIVQDFDRLSIMTYKIPGCWNYQNISLQKNYKLSAIDKQGLIQNYGPPSNPGYNCVYPPPPPPFYQIENFNPNIRTCKSNNKIHILIFFLLVFLIITIILL